jgi:hypothetical protein
LEIARRFSTYEATQFINGILDAIKRDLDQEQPQTVVVDEDEAAAEDDAVAPEEDDEDGNDEERTASAS